MLLIKRLVKVFLVFILFFSFSFNIASAQKFNTDLQYGLKNNNEVVLLQNFLKKMGYFSHVITGNFFAVTQNSVRSWQRDNCLPATGFFGPLSRNIANNIDDNLKNPNGTSACPNNKVKKDDLSKQVTLEAGSLGGQVESVEYIIDNKMRGLVKKEPFSLTTNLKKGTYSLTIRVVYKSGFVVVRGPLSINVDDTINQNSLTIPVTVISGGASMTPITPSAPSISVSVSPTATTSNTYATTSFSATVTNSSNQSVTWSATGGSIDSSGVFTAPSLVTSTTTYSITATSVADATKSGTASITVVPIVVSISPTATSTLSGGNINFSAVVSNATSSSVTWSATGGSIDSSGVFTAPGVTATTTYIVTASSTVNSARAATSSVEVRPYENFVGWWKLDEGSGSVAYDSSGNGNDGTWSGTASGDTGYYHTDGAPGSAFAGNFSSGDDVVTISNIDIGDVRTIAFWAYIPTLSGTTEMISKSSAGQGVEVIVHGDTVYFYVMGSDVIGLAADSSDIDVGSWNHIVTTYNGPNSTMKIYINGAQSGGTATAPNTIGIVDALRFGDWANGDRDFVGRLNDIRMYDVLLTGTEIQNLYDSYPN